MSVVQALPEIEDIDVHYLGSLYTTAALDGMTKGHIASLVRSPRLRLLKRCCLL